MTMVTTKRSTSRTITSSIRSSNNNSHQTNGAIINKTTVPPAWVALLGGVIVAIVSVRLNTWMVSVAEQQQQAAWRDYYQVETVPRFVQSDDATTAQLYTDLHNASLWRACDKITKGATRFWLLHKTESPKNVFEQMAVQIYRNTPYWDQAAAFEYWCNILEVDETEEDRKQEPPQGVELHWHTDRDEDILERERRFVVPLRGAVYYGFPQFEGGQFRIINSVPYHQRPTSSASTVPPAPTDECDPNTHFCITNPSHFGTNDSALYVPVEPNMLLMANVTYFHKVTPLLSGQRFSLAVNADHWLPYDDDTETTEDRQRLSLTNDELLQVASSRDVFPKRKRTIGLTDN